MSAPTCRYCGQPMRAVYDRTYTPGTWKSERSAEPAGYGYSGQNVFCSLRCGYRWAMRHVKG